MSPKQSVMGPGQTKKMRRLADQARLGPQQVDEFLAQLDKWGVSPDTKFDPKVQNDPWMSFPPGQEQTFISGFVIKAGPKGVKWLLDKGFEPDFAWYSQALNSGLDDVDKVFDAIKAAGVSPHEHPPQESLWSLIGAHGNWDPKAIAWARSNRVDWHVFDAQSRQPLHSLISTINRLAGISDFFSPSSPAGFLSDIMSHVPEFSSSVGENKKHLALLEDLAIEMVQSGVSPHHKDKTGIAPIDNVFPEQAHAQQYFLTQANPSMSQEAKGEFVVSQMMTNKQAVDDMKKDASAYGSDQLGFIQRLEQAMGSAILATPAQPRKPRSP